MASTRVPVDAKLDEAADTLIQGHDDPSHAALAHPRSPSTGHGTLLLSLAAVVVMALAAEQPRHSRLPATTLPASHAPGFKPWAPLPAVDGRKLAYMLYATNDLQACNALIAAKKIRALGTPSFIEIVALVTEDVSVQARQVLVNGGVRPMTVARWRRKTGNDYYKDSLTKLRIFQELGYDRVIYVDTDTVIMKNLDELFHLPHAVFWAPRAYWLEHLQPFITSVLLVVDPDNALFTHLEHAIEHETEVRFDMDVLNVEWQHVAGILPSEYVVLTTHLKENVHKYLFGYTSFLDRVSHTYIHHFSYSDQYIKPWTMDADAIERQPHVLPLYYELYEEYWAQRRALCSFL
ncbi:hypothetical protein SPRG_13499 [Saprolegnia parasitica CBS 223.65]|uniref:Nucleotide-diphospho-sugar transferase domain-containing protein n=1 Tax=Saprolegnia parasitica (strain CBS 223.65) TaxID=695850 RepID=A0A067BPD2_SAPPC|nr:hypothetical protein SPRG_13499 [Saprolegnia parasitica CBS 223.65]KDO20354.1 hypothetical protein SPRG_13499 [Saprolegnia parasitica CBS 223.65]|eukprot:XP_012208949.1 hypothetical protein SPRG_13499 [Saprolegnia parasitica CBS 223.65]